MDAALETLHCEQVINEFKSLSKINELLSSNYRLFSEVVNRGAMLFGKMWKIEFDELISTLFTNNELITAAVKGYATFAINTMRLQVVFERERQYKVKTFEETSSEVYFNEQYMNMEYLPGLLLSHFLWPHHYRQLQFFESAFMSAMRAENAQSFVEVGVGTGLYSSLILRKLPKICGIGLDISSSSKKFTENHIAAFGNSNRYHVELRDITVNPLNSKAEWLICIEVLEHLNDPVSFLRGLRRNMKFGAKAFITAALNAAHTDHIYLYHNSGEVLDQLQEAGFALEQSFTARAYNTALGVPSPEVAAFIVY